jgi:hypothetical protein
MVLTSAAQIQPLLPVTGLLAAFSVLPDIDFVQIELERNVRFWATSVEADSYVGQHTIYKAGTTLYCLIFIPFYGNTFYYAVMHSNGRPRPYAQKTIRKSAASINCSDNAAPQAEAIKKSFSLTVTALNHNSR